MWKRQVSVPLCFGRLDGSFTSCGVRIPKLLAAAA
jgi:hypothetical protein